MTPSPDVAMLLSGVVLLVSAVGLFLAILTIRKYRALFLQEKTRYDVLYAQYMDLLSKHIANAGKGETVH